MTDADSRWSSFSILGAVVLIAAVSFFYLGPSRRSEAETQSLLAPRPEPLPALKQNDTYGFRQPRERLAPTPQQSDLNSPKSPAAGQDVEGFVCDEATGVGLSDCRIEFSVPVDTRGLLDNLGRYPPPLLAVTDEGGSFTMTLDGEGWKPGRVYGASVKMASGATVFDGYVQFQEHMVFSVRTPRYGRGQLIGSDRLSYDGFEVSIRGTGDRATRPRARVALDPSGRFEALVAALEPTEGFVLQFFRKDTSGYIAVRATSDQLFSMRGVQVRRDFFILKVLTQEHDGTPISEAQVSLASLSSERLLPSPTARTDSQGAVSFLAESGAIEVCAGKEGYFASVSTLELSEEPETARHVLQMRSLADEDLVIGQVYSHDRVPVENAFVSIYPVGRINDVSLAAQVGTRTDQEGTFELPRVSEDSILRAYHNKYGLTAPVKVERHDRSVRILFDPVGAIHATLTHSFEQPVFSSGLLRYILVDRFVDRSFSEHMRPPLVVQMVPEGDYNLYVLLSDGYGEASVSTYRDIESEVNVLLEPATWFAGRILHQDGSPAKNLSVRLSHPDWSEEVIARWGTVRTTEQGKFRLLGGTLGSGTIEVAQPPGEPACFQVDLRGEQTFYLAE